jgi:hypothetical protein
LKAIKVRGDRRKAIKDILRGLNEEKDYEKFVSDRDWNFKRDSEGELEYVG